MLSPRNTWVKYVKTNIPTENCINLYDHALPKESIPYFAANTKAKETKTPKTKIFTHVCVLIHSDLTEANCWNQAPD